MATSPSSFSIALPSFYANTPTYALSNGNVVFGLEMPPILPDPTDIVYTVPQGRGNRLDLIANDLYGDPRLWWVIATVNSIVDPFTEAPFGTSLRVPTVQRVQLLT